MKRVSIERLRAALAYCPRTGQFTWRMDVMCGRYFKQFAARAGSPAGSVSGGRVQIRLDGRNYKAHVLAWAHAYGKWPTTEIDHRDTDATNNALSNLRAATREVNAQNIRAARSNNQLGVLGVHRKGNRFIAQLCVNGENTYLGIFADAESAHAAYLTAKRAHHEGCTI